MGEIFESDQSLGDESPLNSYNEQTPQDQTEKDVNDINEIQLTPQEKEPINSNALNSNNDSDKTKDDIPNGNAIPPVNISRSPETSKTGQILGVLQEHFKTKYNPIPYESKQGKYFFLGLDTYKRIISQMPSTIDLINTKLGKNDQTGNEDRWKMGIESILYKALVAESVKYAQWMAEDISERFKNKSSVKLLELCSGAGITTSMMYLERLNQNPEAKTQIISIDNSTESIACASLMALSFGIPCTVCNTESLENIDPDYNGIVFVREDAVKFVDQLTEDKAKDFDCVISDNGISYFPEDIHDHVISELKEKMGDKFLFYLSSLKKGVSVSLGLPFKIKGILKGKNFEVRPGDGYVEKDGIISETYTEETRSFFILANKMLKGGRRGLKDLVSMLGILSSATKSTQDLNIEMETPADNTASKINSGELDNYEIEKTFPEDKKAPCQAIIIK